jgi:ABC-2 type transport system permease protein
MIARIRAIARATFREAVRDRVLLIVVLFAIGMVLISRVLGWLSIEDPLKMVQDFSLTGINLLGLLLAMLIGASSLAREVERRTVYSVLTRRANRTEFILGKFVGLVGVFWVCQIGATACLAVWLLAWGGTLGAALIAALLGMMLEIVMLTAVALFLGALAAPAIASIGTAVFYFAGHGTEALRELSSEHRNHEFSGLFEVLYLVIPNLENVNFINHTTSGHAVIWTDLGMGAVYAVLVSAAFLAGASYLFSRRQF